jgi:hypothetical protein
MMDALCFVLGLRASALRGASLKDLVYRGPDGATPKRGASVKLVFNSGTEIIVFQRYSFLLMLHDAIFAAVSFASTLADANVYTAACSYSFLTEVKVCNQGGAGRIPHQ